jgi:hypothetical protein
MQRGIAVMVLTALAGAPASAAVCDIQCRSATAQHSTTETSGDASAMAGDCHGSSTSGQFHVRTPSSHPCGDHDLTFEDAAAAQLASRGNATELLHLAAAVLALHSAPQAPETSLRSSSSLGPPLPPPAPTRAPLVLRI